MENNDEMVQVPKHWYLQMQYLGLTPNPVRDHNIGASNYAKMLIQPWSIWIAFKDKLTFWEADLLAYILRIKEGETRLQTLKKELHIIQEEIRQEETLQELRDYERQLQQQDTEQYGIG